MNGESVDHDSWLHRADVRSKSALFGALVVASFIARGWWAMLILALFAVLILASARSSARQLLRALQPLALVMACIFIFAALSPPRWVDQTVLVHLLPGQRLGLTVGGLDYGASLTLRLITMVAATMMLVGTTPAEQFGTWLQQLRAPRAITFIAVTALRFVPTMRDRSQEILAAQRARGAAIDTGGLIGKVKAFATIMVPLFATSIRSSEQLAVAMLARGFDSACRPTRLHDLRWSKTDQLIVLLALGLVGLACWQRISC